MTQTNVNVQMQIRRDTAANWASTNPVLLAGEWGYVTDTGKFKIGNGSTNFTFLPDAVLSTFGGTLTDHLKISNQKELRLSDDTANTANEHYSSFKAGSQSANINYTLPTTAPTDNQYLKCSAAGVLSWDTFTGTDIADLLSNDGNNRILTATGTTNSFNAEANLIFDGSRLLIGTTTEGHGNADDLTIATGSNTGITIRSGATNGGNIFFSNATSGSGEYAGMISYDHNTNDMTFATTDGSERLRIDSSGRIGINDTSPTAELSVAATAPHIDIGVAGGTRFKIGYEGNNCFFGGTSSTAMFVFKQNVDAEGHPQASGSEVMKLDSDGNLLIGTTTKGVGGADELTINTPSNHGGITIRNDSSSNGNIFFSDGTSGATEYAGHIQYLHASDAMVFGINATEKMRVDNNGSLAIGLTSAQGVLHVYKATGAQRSYFESGNSHSFIRLIGSSGSDNSGLEFYSGSSGNRANITANGAGGLNFEVGGNSNALFISDSGKVNIGSTAGSAALTVVSSDVNIAVLGTTNNNGAYLEMNLGGSGAALGYIGSAGQLVSGGSASDFVIRAQGLLRFAIDSSPKVNIKSTGHLDIINGNLEVASGHGIDFSNVSDGSRSVNSNLLDDFEQGTFNPTDDFSTMSFQGAHYIKIAKMVYFWISYYVSAGNGAFSSGQKIGNLPFNNAQTDNSVFETVTASIYHNDNTMSTAFNYLNQSEEITFQVAKSSVSFLWIQGAYVTDS